MRRSNLRIVALTLNCKNTNAKIAAVALAGG